MRYGGFLFEMSYSRRYVEARQNKENKEADMRQADGFGLYQFR
jgi:hypothetical protein